MNKPKCTLIGENGNIFNLLGIVTKTLKRNGLGEQVEKVTEEVFSSESYEEALTVLGKYVDIE